MPKDNLIVENEIAINNCGDGSAFAGYDPVVWFSPSSQKNKKKPLRAIIKRRPPNEGQVT